MVETLQLLDPRQTADLLTHPHHYGETMSLDQIVQVVADRVFNSTRIGYLVQPMETVNYREKRWQEGVEMLLSTQKILDTCLTIAKGMIAWLQLLAQKTDCQLILCGSQAQKELFDPARDIDFCFFPICHDIKIAHQKFEEALHQTPRCNHARKGKIDSEAGAQIEGFTLTNTIKQLLNLSKHDSYFNNFSIIFNRRIFSTTGGWIGLEPNTGAGNHIVDRIIEFGFGAQVEINGRMYPATPLSYDRFQNRAISIGTRECVVYDRKSFPTHGIPVDHIQLSPTTNASMAIRGLKYGQPYIPWQPLLPYHETTNNNSYAGLYGLLLPTSRAFQVHPELLALLENEQYVTAVLQQVIPATIALIREYKLHLRNAGDRPSLEAALDIALSVDLSRIHDLSPTNQRLASAIGHVVQMTGSHDVNYTTSLSGKLPTSVEDFIVFPFTSKGKN